MLDTYDVERREHAAAMIQLSVIAGRIFSPTKKWLAALRDGLTLVLNMIPSVKSYFLQMRFKPMPRYADGAVVQDAVNGKIATSSPVGRLFIQPDVRIASGATVKLDDALGPWFAVVTWAVDPTRHVSAQTHAFWTRPRRTIRDRDALRADDCRGRRQNQRCDARRWGQRAVEGMVRWPQARVRDPASGPLRGSRRDLAANAGCGDAAPGRSDARRRIGNKRGRGDFGLPPEAVTT